ncbi:MAG: histidine kinase dimerization/phospho-acceptor domain-containing protein [Bacteroidota bacterium]
MANMSHEMRTPLIGVKGIAQLLYKTTLSEK